LHFEEAALSVLGTNFKDECNTLNNFIFHAALQYLCLVQCIKTRTSRLLGRGLEFGYTGQTNGSLAKPHE